MASTNYYTDFSNNKQNMYNYAASSYYDNSYYQQTHSNTTWNPATYSPSYTVPYHNTTLDSTSSQMYNDYYNYNNINEQLPSNSSSLQTSESAKISMKRKATELEEPLNKTKKVSKEDSEEPPSKLRALLTNPVKKLKYSPDYYYTSIEKVNKIKSQDTISSSQPSPPQCYEQDLLADHTPSTQQTILSPVRSEVDYLDVYSSLSLKQASCRKSSKTGSSSSTTTTITSSNSESSTPASLVDGISTPPLSPIDKHVNHQHQHEINHKILTGHNYNWSNCEDSPASDCKHSKRTRQTYTRYQTLKLEKAFNFRKYITKLDRTNLAKDLALTERQVKIWFQNRRMKSKKDGTLDDSTELLHQGLAYPTLPLESSNSQVPFVSSRHRNVTSASYASYLPSSPQSFVATYHHHHHSPKQFVDQHNETSTQHVQLNHHVHHSLSESQQYSTAAAHFAQHNYQQQHQMSIPAGSNPMF